MRRRANAQGRRVGEIFSVLALLPIALLLAACGESATPPQPTADVEARPAPTSFALPTLYPTATRAQQQVTPTREMPATQSPESTADLQETVVAFRYIIPALGLDRRLEGTVGGTVTVVDEAAGIAATLQNQGGVLFELQSTLPKLELAEIPNDCSGCVFFSYGLPIEGEEDSGWLQDPVMLASVENYLALALGPHWPEGTVVGLRRSASPYHVAHTIAQTAGGEMYRWSATEPEVRGSEEGSVPVLPDEGAALAPEYSVVCPGAPLETLYLAPTADDEDAPSATNISISCPAFSLPASLVATYLALDEQLSPLLADDRIPVPPSEIPLAAMVVHERQDRGRLVILIDDRVVFEDVSGEVITDTLGAGTAISMSAALQESESLTTGVAAYTAAEAKNTLLVRTEAGMSEVAWDEAVPETLVPALTALEAVWEELTPETALEATGTGTPEATGTVSPAATGSATPQATSTP